MKNSITPELSSSFQLASVIATVLVIAIHYHSKFYITELGSFNYLFQEFLTNGVARIAVPYFAFSAGFFLFIKYQGLTSYKQGVKKRVKTILFPYLICSIFMFFTRYFYLTVLKGNEYSLSPSILLHEILIVPVSVQLWFLRDLMFLVLIAPVINILVSFSFGVGVIVVGILWFLEIQISPSLGGKYLITIETLFYFSLGACVVKYIDILNSYLEVMRKEYKYGLVCFVLLIVGLRVYQDPFFLVGYSPSNYTLMSLLLYKAAIFIGVFALLIISYNKTSKLVSRLASFTFFVYLYHLLPLSYVVTKLGHLLLPNEYVFYFNFPFAVLVSFVGAYSLSQVVPKVYSALAGGRGV